MKKPTQCALWGKKNLQLGDLNMKIVSVLARSTHIERDLLRCGECGQLYFHEWYEHISFKHSADSYDTYIPVESEAEAQKLQETESTGELAKFLPQLHGSFTNNANESLRWIQTADEWATA